MLGVTCHKHCPKQKRKTPCASIENLNPQKDNGTDEKKKLRFKIFWLFKATGITKDLLSRTKKKKLSSVSWKSCSIYLPSSNNNLEHLFKFHISNTNGCLQNQKQYSTHDFQTKEKNHAGKLLCFLKPDASHPTLFLLNNSSIFTFCAYFMYRTRFTFQKH